MTEKCFDEGTIQAFLDGELETDLLESVARHTAACEVCAFMMQEAEAESSFAFSALGEEFNSLVPTERIRTNLYDAISQIEKPRQSLWSRIFGEGFSFSNPSILAFASLLLVFGLFTTLYVKRGSQNTSTDTIAKAEQPTASAPVVSNLPVINQTSDTTGNQTITTARIGNQTEQPKVERPTYRLSGEHQPTIQKAGYKIERNVPEARRPDANRQPKVKNERETIREGLPGEESYVKTIATLTDNVESRKDNVLRPSERVAFEKDLAVVNDAISKMQKEVRKNPRNEAAKQVLKSSYQNKIDLLNSVAEKSELMAALD
jgi:anti-sigma factor RsiW